jgi:hypothetical protein
MPGFCLNARIRMDRIFENDSRRSGRGRAIRYAAHHQKPGSVGLTKHDCARHRGPGAGAMQDYDVTPRSFSDAWDFRGFPRQHLLFTALLVTLIQSAHNRQ